MPILNVSLILISFTIILDYDEELPNPRLSRAFSVSGSTRASRVVVGASADHIFLFYRIN